MAERLPTQSPAVPAGTTFRISAVAQRTGLSEQVIRAWERRYGILTPKRSAAGYRGYTEEDIKILLRLKELTGSGIAISDAAKVVPQIRKEVRAQLQRARPYATTELGPRIAWWQAELLGAAARMDQPAIEQLLDSATAALAPVELFERLVAPVAKEIGERWFNGKLSIASEHLATETFRTRMRALIGQRTTSEGASAHALTACLPDEQHDLGILGVSLKLRHLGMRVTSLGMRTPADELVRAATQLSPDFIALSAILDPGPAALNELLGQLRNELPPGMPILLGGRAAQVHASLLRARRVQLCPDLSALDGLAPRPNR